MRRLPRASSFAALILFAPAAAHAAGLEVLTNGSQSMGRGGAFVAKADDPTAIEHNPAGLGKLRGFRLTIDNNLIGLASSFQRTGNYPACAMGEPMCGNEPFSGQPFPKVENQRGISWVPQIALTAGLGSRVTIGAGVFGPSAPRGVEFQETYTLPNGATAPGPQRYDLIKSDLFVAFPTFSVGVRAASWLDLGASFHYGYSNLKFKNVVAVPRGSCGGIPNDDGGFNGGADESSNCDVSVDLDTTDTSSISASFGALVRPSENIELGFALRLPTDIEADGHALVIAHIDGPTIVLGREDEMDPSSECPGGMAERKRLEDQGLKCVRARATLKTGLPLKAKVGARYVFRSGDEETGDVELDFNYEAWSKFDYIGVSMDGIEPETEPTIPVWHRYDDTIALRLGGSKVIPLGANRLAVRAGISYDTAAAPEAYTKNDFAAWQKLGFSVGLGYTLGSFILNAGYAFVMMPERNITDTNITQTNALWNGSSPANPDPPSKEPGRHDTTFVGNGVYTASYSIFNVGVGLAF